MFKFNKIFMVGISKTKCVSRFHPICIRQSRVWFAGIKIESSQSENDAFFDSSQPKNYLTCFFQRTDNRARKSNVFENVQVIFNFATNFSALAWGGVGWGGLLTSCYE